MIYANSHPGQPNAIKRCNAKATSANKKKVEDKNKDSFGS